MTDIAIVAFLQNQWFKDPERAKEVFARNPESRERLLARYLFAGCLTGKRLQNTFGTSLYLEREALYAPKIMRVWFYNLRLLLRRFLS